MRLKIAISGLVAGCLLVTGSRVWAQNTNATPTPPPNKLPPSIRTMPGGPGGPGGAAPRAGLAGILSEEQQASFQKVNTELRGKLMELQTKYQNAQKEVFEAGLSTNFDENVVRQKAQAAAEIWADMLVTRAKAPSEIQPPLSADQIEKIRNMQSPSPAANPRVLRAPPQPGAPTNPAQNGPPPKP